MSLTAVWSQVENLLSEGLSLIPVRDKSDEKGVAKSPYSGWKRYQASPITAPDLWADMDRFKTEAIAIIAGKVSGNLEVIDIDVKYKPGIDAVLLSDIKQLYPSLFNRLRIHSTPSGGYHILYRVSDGVIPGNQKLAGRDKTPDELSIAPKPRSVNFLETRGEGGYVVAPPSLKYGIHQDLPIPTISWAERCSLIALCRTYSEITPIADQLKPTTQQSDYYDENPFQHFNRSPEGANVLVDHGWKSAGSNTQFLWFTRPGKDKGISASYNKTKAVYYIFTASTEFDDSKGYNPATVLSILAHGGNKKKTFQELVQRGYGVIKPSIENKIAKKKALTSLPLPPNASAEARAEYDTQRAIIQSTYPYGIFWHYNEENELVVNREALYRVAEGIGFRLYQQSPVRIDGFIIRHQTERDFFDAVKRYIKEEDAIEYEKLCNIFEPFIQRNGAFTITRLPLLQEDAIIKDTSTACYKFYQNGYLFITAQEYSFQTYDNLAGLVWDDQILPRQYIPASPGGRYVEFLALSTEGAPLDHVEKIIGYLSHQYKDETTGYIIVLTEQCPDPKQGGGSGKNIFSSLFTQVTTYKSIPGSQVKYDEKFLNAWSGERIFAVSDVPKRFDFSFLKELSTGSGILKKLFKDEIAVGVQDMPKFIIQSNFSYDVSDGGLKRRIIPIEFTDFFTKCGGVDVHFGCHFPKGWTGDDWAGFDNYIASCIQKWLAAGMKLFPIALTEGGWQKQFEQTWGHICNELIEEYHENWWMSEFVKNDDFRQQIDNWCRENNTPMTYRPSMQKLNGAIQEWAKHHNKQFIPNHSKKEMGISVRGKWFGNQEDTPF